VVPWADNSPPRATRFIKPESERQTVARMRQSVSYKSHTHLHSSGHFDAVQLATLFAAKTLLKAVALLAATERPNGRRDEMRFAPNV